MGVSISLVSGRKSMQLIRDIEEYFHIKMTPLPMEDWDEVETVIKKVIKSSRAGKDFNRNNAVSEDQSM